MFNRNTLLTAVALASASLGAQATVLDQWTFNSSNLTPFTGTGTASYVGTAAASSGAFAAGVSGASNDKAWNTASYAAQGAGDKTRGVQFSISTLGFENIVFSYDSKHSGTASAYEQVQYSLNGTTFVDLGVPFGSGTNQNFITGRTIDLSSIAATDNQAHVYFRIVSTFNPGTSSYIGTGSGYSTGGTMRFDNVTISGTALAPVPEPETYALMLAGLAGIGFVARRRSPKA